MRAPVWMALLAPATTLACLTLPEETMPLSPLPSARTVLQVERKRDPRTGLEQHVLPGVELGVARPVELDMRWSSGFAYSFVPESAARAMGAQALETLDLGVLAPAVPAELEAMHGMNRHCQRVFEVVRIDVVDLGVGPAFGPVRALVLDDENSEFGLIGSDWSSFRCGNHVFRHVRPTADHPSGAIVWVEERPRKK